MSLIGRRFYYHHSPGQPRTGPHAIVHVLGGPIVDGGPTAHFGYVLSASVPEPWEYVAWANSIDCTLIPLTDDDHRRSREELLDRALTLIAEALATERKR